jgi:hypothetical protein
VYRARFNDVDDFPDAAAGGDIRGVPLVCDVLGHIGRGTIRLVDQPNPYMIDGETHWLSVDLRVFRVRDSVPFLGSSVSGDPLGFIRGATEAMTPGQFDDLPTEGGDAQLNIASHEGGQRVWNFAVAQVRYRATAGNHAPGIRCFFRMFQTAVANMRYDKDSTYRSAPGPGGEPVPLLGHIGGETVTIPFFDRTRSPDMTDQEVSTRTLSGTGGESTAYFGAWLDINEPTDFRFREYFDPDNDGPYLAGGGEPLRTIQQLVTRGAHQCLVAEIVAGDLLVEGDTPGSSDKLAQRNIAYVPADNPGSPTSRVVQHTFDLAPVLTPRAVHTLLQLHGVLAPAGASPDDDVAGDIAAAPNQLLAAGRKRIPLVHDELLIDWGGLPADTTASLFLPAADIDTMLTLHRLRAGPRRLERTDATTLRMAAHGATHLPLVGRSIGNIAGLMTIELPDTIVAGDHYRVVAHHVDGTSRQVLGSFELSIPVAKADALAPEAANQYAVLRWVDQSLSPASRWRPVFERYLDQVANRLDGLGVDPATVAASPAGTGLLTPADAAGGIDTPDHGLPLPGKAAEGRRIEGRVVRILYDCFGHFDGFVVETCGREVTVSSCESGIERVVRRACADRLPIAVVVDPRRQRVVRIELGCC